MTTAIFLLVSYHTYALQQTERRVADLKVEAERYQTEHELTQNLAHDLRTPMTVIKTSAYLIQKSVENGQPAEKHLQNMNRYLKHMDMMITDLLELTFLDSSDAATQREPVNIRRLVSTSVTSLEEYARQRSISLRFVDAAGHDIYARGNETQLKRMLDNLIENGIQFGRDGGYVRVVLKNSGSQVEIRVEDDGIGIAPEHHQAVFERFFRVDQARTPHEGQGTGVGLSIVSRVVQLHGGSVSLESELDKGSTFTILIPALPPNA